MEIIRKEREKKDSGPPKDLTLDRIQTYSWKGRTITNCDGDDLLSRVEERKTENKKRKRLLKTSRTLFTRNRTSGLFGREGTYYHD